MVLWFERLLNLKTCLKKQQGEFKRTEIVLIRVQLETVTRSGDREIRSVSGRLPGYPGELVWARCSGKTPGYVFSCLVVSGDEWCILSSHISFFVRLGNICEVYMK